MPQTLCQFCHSPFEQKPGRGQARRYCGNTCVSAAYRLRRKAEREQYERCEVDGCELPRRSRTARWCEAHYVRWNRHGDPLADKRSRPPTGRCQHCGAAAGRRNVFCAPLCKTRSRIGADFVVRTCTICAEPLPFKGRPDRLYCSNECGLIATRLRRYGISHDVYRDMLLKQDGRCAICKRAERLFIDHCHTGQGVRGLLCTQCNVGVGMFAEDIARLRSAIRYLQVKERQR